MKFFKLPSYFLQIVAISSLSLVLMTSGVQFTWTSPYIPYVSSKDFPGNISFDQASYFTVIPPLTTMILVPIFSSLIDIFGRKLILLLAAPFQFSAWIFIYFSTSLWALYVSRFCVGVSDAIFWSAAPAYIGEICSPKVRGTWGNLPSILMYFGEVLVVFLAYYLDYFTNSIILSVFPLIFFASFFFLPESPYFYVKEGKKSEALDSLKRLNGNGEAACEQLKTLTKSVEEAKTQKGSFKELFWVDSNRKAILVSVGARAANNFSGLPAFTTYAHHMFRKAGTNMSDEISALIFVSFLWIFSTIFLFFQDKFGRRKLMTFSCIGSTVCLALETIYFYLDQYTMCDLASLKWFPLTFMVLYLFFFSAGLGIVPTIILSELFATNVKAKAMIVSNIFFTICTLSIPKLFQLMTDDYGLFVPFLFFSFCTFLASLFSYFYLPETKGKTLEEIQIVLRKNNKR